MTSNLTASSDPDTKYLDRIHGRQLLLENPARDSRKRKEEEQREKTQERKKQHRARGIGKREAVAKGVWKLNKEQAKYAEISVLKHIVLILS